MNCRRLVIAGHDDAGAVVLLQVANERRDPRKICRTTAACCDRFRDRFELARLDGPGVISDRAGVRRRRLDHIEAIHVAVGFRYAPPRDELARVTHKTWKSRRKE